MGMVEKLISNQKFLLAALAGLSIPELAKMFHVTEGQVKAALEVLDL
jgi:DNA-directed RNA polymerase specialized sigma24 family protein